MLSRLKVKFISLLIQSLLIDKYLDFTSLFTETVISRARECTFVQTIAGRRRYVPKITSGNPAKRAKAERQAVNSTIQGSAADIVKMAMLQMDRCLRQRANNWRNVKLILHVHDELVYEVPKDIVNDVVRKLKVEMENCWPLRVPLRVKVKVGNNWGAMEVYDG